uniref:Ovule protein n=1 Tax=Steinernema glaseri TaxID=37863 RepID=A0A1I8AP93_9BILA
MILKTKLSVKTCTEISKQVKTKSNCNGYKTESQAQNRNHLCLLTGRRQLDQNNRLGAPANRFSELPLREGLTVRDHYSQQSSSVD